MQLREWSYHFEQAYKNAVDKFINGDEDAFYSPGALHRPKARKKKKLTKLLEVPYKPEEKEEFRRALVLIKNLLPQQLTSDVWEIVEKEFSAVESNAVAFYEQHASDVDKVLATSIQEISGISDNTLENCYHLGLELFTDDYYEDARVIFHFLRTLAPYELNAWVGEIMCMKSSDAYSQAIDHINLAHTLFPESTLLHIHLVDCFLETKNPFQAGKELEVARSLAESEGINKEFEETFSYLEDLLTKDRES